MMASSPITMTKGIIRKNYSQSDSKQPFFKKWKKGLLLACALAMVKPVKAAGSFDDQIRLLEDAEVAVDDVVVVVVEGAEEPAEVVEEKVEEEVITDVRS